MKNISNQKWFSLSIKLDAIDNLDFIYGQFYDYMTGLTENHDELIFYFEDNKKEAVQSIISNQFINHDFNIQDIEYQNWHTSYEKYFKPIEINKDLMIVPHWEETKKNIDYIRIIPGMAFGTGTHETTQLIISNMIDYIKPSYKVLDLGAGSGILGIAALKFQAQEIIAVEYDEDCKDNFIENMELNNFHDKYTLLLEDVLLYQNYDVDLILANINKNIILDLLPNIKRYQKNRPKIILSGLLVDDRRDIVNLINKLDFNLIKEAQQGEWICIIID